MNKQDIQKLRSMRDRHGSDSLVGRLCSNLIPMLRNLPSYIAPVWATHESQTLQGKTMWQLAQLETALQGR